MGEPSMTARASKLWLLGAAAGLLVTLALVALCGESLTTTTGDLQQTAEPQAALRARRNPADFGSWDSLRITKMAGDERNAKRNAMQNGRRLLGSGPRDSRVMEE